MMKPILVVVTGSRDWTDRIKVESILHELDPVFVMHGHCPSGADAIADAWAGETAIRMPAQWSRDGYAAGPTRNKAMLDAAKAFVACGWQVVCVAFPLPSSRGTIHCMRLFSEAGFPVEVIAP